MKTAVDIPDEIFTELKIYSVRRRKKLKEVIVMFLSRGLAEVRAEGLARDDKTPALRELLKFGAKLKIETSPVGMLLKDRSK